MSAISISITPGFWRTILRADDREVAAIGAAEEGDRSSCLVWKWGSGKRGRTGYLPTWAELVRSGYACNSSIPVDDSVWCVHCDCQRGFGEHGFKMVHGTADDVKADIGDRGL